MSQQKCRNRHKQQVKAYDDKISKLKEEIEILKDENRILLKTIKYFEKEKHNQTPMSDHNIYSSTYPSIASQTAEQYGAATFSESLSNLTDDRFPTSYPNQPTIFIAPFSPFSPV